MADRTKKYRALKRKRDECHSSDEKCNFTSSENTSNTPTPDTSIDEEATVNQHTAHFSQNSDCAVNVSSQPSRSEVTARPISKDNVPGTSHIANVGSEDTSKYSSLVNVHLSEASSSSECDSDDDSAESRGSSTASERLDVPSSPEDLNTHSSLRDKLRNCAVKHINHVTHSFLNDLLGILRSEGHTDLPKNSVTLLRTERTDGRIQPMLSKRGTFGTYMYLGIENNLQRQIANSDYDEREIRVLINVDGLPIYARSRQQMWPILMQILHKDYYCKPTVVALYCGDSKPNDPNDLMGDFVEECTALIDRGLIVKNTLFSFEIAAFVCDTPARAFIKCCKGHTGFYGCERCEVHGKTVNKRRVYPQASCVLRNKDSFITKRQTDHHVPDTTSPLVRIPGFDPVSRVVLDYMHLLCCGAMKSLFDKWLSTKKQEGNIGRRERCHLSELLLGMSTQIPVEFQRKVFDLTDISNWKATQYRFMLLYAGGLILRQVLKSEVYRHFLLLFVASRILCSRTWALMYTNEAESFLRDFFTTLRNFYGKDSQSMNFHNLIHLADDVKNLQAPLTDYSSFPFENCLGTIKRLIRTPRDPVAQVFRRLSEINSDIPTIQKYDLAVITSKRRVLDKDREIDTVEYSKINIKTMSIGITPPDNVVKLINEDIFKIDRIFATNSDPNKIRIQGEIIRKKGDAFSRPMASSRIGIYEVGLPFGFTRTYSIDSIVEKILVLNVERRKYAVTMLHLN